MKCFTGSETQSVRNAVTIKQGNQRKSRRMYDELEIDGAPAISAVILRLRYQNSTAPEIVSNSVIQVLGPGPEAFVSRPLKTNCRQSRIEVRPTALPSVLT